VELIGQGIANIVFAPLFGGLPANGRHRPGTATNVRLGGEEDAPLRESFIAV